MKMNGQESRGMNMNQKQSSTWKVYLALFSGFAALATHFYLSKHYFELHLGLSSGAAICNLNNTFNCDAVSASKFSTLFGMPIAIWGLATQIILVLFTLTFGLGLSSDRSRIGRYTFFLSFFIALTSVVMGGISMMFLGTYCLFCMVAYALSFIHLYCSWSLQSASPFSLLGKDIIAAVTNFKWVGLSVASIIPLAFLFNNMFLDHYGGSLLKDTIESSFAGWQGAPQNNFTNEGLVKGPEAARMTIVEYADFLCPHCKHAVPGLKVFTESHPNVRMIFKAFPLDGTCNASTEMPKGDGTRCLLAKTVWCAEKLAKKGWPVYEKIFEQQEEYHGSGKQTELLKALLAENDLDSAAMETCRNSEETHKSIVAQSQEGLNAKIEGTPSIFVNGKFLSRGHLLPVLQRVYDSLE
jgi:protein-disulfide isomerase/uncharacterized membrane protein